MSKQKEPSEGDIIFNRANVALAKHQRLVASWLPPKTEAELANTKSQEELDREEEEMFAPVPELLGVGAIPPKDKDGLPKRSDVSALDKLRTQLLGKKAVAAGKPNQSKPKPPNTKSVKPEDEASEDDEEESRARTLSYNPRNMSSAFKPPPHENRMTETREQQLASTVNGPAAQAGTAELFQVLGTGDTKSKISRKKLFESADEPNAPSNGDEKEDARGKQKKDVSAEPKTSKKKRASNFMDELLQQKGKKKKKW